MKRLFTLFFMLALVALCGAVGAPIGDLVRGVCVTCFAVGLVATTLRRRIPRTQKGLA